MLRGALANDGRDSMLEHRRVVSPELVRHLISTRTVHMPCLVHADRADLVLVSFKGPEAKPGLNLPLLDRVILGTSNDCPGRGGCDHPVDSTCVPVPGGVEPLVLVGEADGLDALSS